MEVKKTEMEVKSVRFRGDGEHRDNKALSTNRIPARTNPQRRRRHAPAWVGTKWGPRIERRSGNMPLALA